MSVAPIALFIYNRLNQIRATVAALQKNDFALESPLIIFSDGPTEDQQSKELVSEARSFLSTINGFASIEIVERDINLGLARSIVSGITDVLKTHDSIIVLEDDLITSPYFLKFMNDALNYYEKEEKVISIHGYLGPVRKKMPPTFLLRGADCQGWATWKRGWDLFNSNAAELLDELVQRNLTEKFDYNGNFGHTQMLRAEVANKNRSWAIKWHASAFVNRKLTLYPGKSLVFHNGGDGSGTNAGQTSFWDVELTDEPVLVGGIPIEESKAGYLAYVDLYKRARKNSSPLIWRILDSGKKYVPPATWEAARQSVPFGLKKWMKRNLAKEK